MDQIPNYITAIATLGLLLATGVLAAYTKLLADISSAPQVVAVLQPSRWSMMHLDIEVENTGNAPAFDVEITFDPPLMAEKTGKSDLMPAPFQNVGLLKPKQILSSFLGETRSYLDRSYRVTVSWSRSPGERKRRTTLSYDCNLAHLNGATRLGPGEPAAATADELKRIREGILPFFRGNRRVDVDVHTQADRDARSAAVRKHFDEERVARQIAESTLTTDVAQNDEPQPNDPQPKTD